MPELEFLFINHTTKNKKLIVDELRNSGLSFNHQSVTDEKQITQALNNNNPNIIFSGHSITTSSTIKTINEIRINYPHIPIIIVSDEIDNSTAVELIKSGATDCVITDSLFRIGHSVKLALELSSLKKENEKVRKECKNTEDKFNTFVFQAFYK